MACNDSTEVLSPIRPPEPFHVHPKRHVSASEDFRCRDPFAGPLGVSSHTMSSIPLTRAAPYKPLFSISGKRQNRTRLAPSRQAPKSSQGLRPSFNFFSIGSSKPAMNRGANSTYVGSFYTGKAVSEERETKKGDSRKSITADSSLDHQPRQISLDPSTGWSPSAEENGLPLPSHPPQMHLSPEVNRIKHSKTQSQSSHVSKSFSSPKASILDVQADSAISSPSHGHKNLSIDRTPTQSLYQSKRNPGAQLMIGTMDRDEKDVQEKVGQAPNSGRGSFLEIEDVPSFDSMRSIPSLPDTPDQTFSSDYDMTANSDRDDSLTTEVSPVVEPFLGIGVHEGDVTSLGAGIQDVSGFESETQKSISRDLRHSKVVANDTDINSHIIHGTPC
jgi:hypothetical protein